LLRERGVGLSYDQAAPAARYSDSSISNLLALSGTAKDHIQSIMDLSRHANIGSDAGFWPTFVDAGIPELTWTYPSTNNRNGRYPIWKIYMKDCGDIVKTTDRNIAKVNTEDEHGLLTTCARKTKWSKIAENIDIDKGVKEKKTFSDAYYWDFKVKYLSKEVTALANKYEWIPSKSSVEKTIKLKAKYTSGKKKGQHKTKKKWYYRPTLYGKKLTVSKSLEAMTENRPGETLTWTPLIYGQINQVCKENGVTVEENIYPDYGCIFSRSNKSGSFTWKGDPRIQPRDVFYLYDKDDETKYTVCTIETVTLKHEGGGLSASITYREGIC
jgi:hypothetical protein